MRFISFLISLLFINSAFGQLSRGVDGPCKPIDEMRIHYNTLAKSSTRTDIFDFDVHYYDLDLIFNDETESIQGRVEVHLLPEVDALESVILDFASGMIVDAVSGNAASFNHFSDQLSIALDGSYNIGEPVVVIVEYHGQPSEVGFQGLTFSHQYGNPSRPTMISSLSEPYGSRSWWPCKDVTTDKADSVRISITADAALDAVSNGMLVSETLNPDNTKTTVWKHNYPITTYLVSVAITEYFYWTETFHFTDGDSMPLEYWMYPPSATESIMEVWNRTEVMMDVFNGYFGKYPFAEEKYGMAQFGWGGAMEHQTCSSMGSFGENTIAHELAHQWWGNLVTCSDFHHIWINEGFATYSEALYWGAVNGEAAYHEHMADKVNNVNSSVYRPDTTSVGAIFSYSMVYQKGAWVLHMLRHVVSDDTFFESLAAYREEYQFRTASTEDFQAVVESVWGGDLEWFFDQWIYGISKPAYRYWWTASEANEHGNSQVLVHVDQVQSTNYPTFKMPIDLTFGNGTEEETVVIWDSLRAQDFNLELGFVPTTMSFDEENWVLKTATQVAGIDGEILPANFRLHAAYPNPFNAEIRIPYTTMTSFQGELTIYDLRGRHIQSAIIHHDKQGTYEMSWDGMNNHGLAVDSGIYLVKLSSATGETLTQKISLLK